MDLLKVLDQTVREIKREVNLKVLKVPEIEQKVLDATSDEPWGPHGSDMSEIAQATKKISDCQIIMNVLWTRLTDTGPNWRHVYKALAVIEYLLANGSERAVDDILEHTFRISSISGFEYLEPNGKDMGINVRKKVEAILSLLNNKEKMQAVRDKAAANRNKYIGLSSTGITYKSSSASYGTSSFHTSDRYGGLGSAREGDSFKNSYKDRERNGEETAGSLGNENAESKSKKGMARNARDQDSTRSSILRQSTKSDPVPSSKSSHEQPDNYDDDFDDFDPRGPSTAGASNVNHNQVDLFGQSSVGDLLDAPTSIPQEVTTFNIVTPEVDLFADPNFISAPLHTEATGASQTQGDIDLFAAQPAFPAAFTSNVDFFAGPPSSAVSETKSPKIEPANTSTFDPFAAIPLNSFGTSDTFGDFATHSGPVTTELPQNFANNSINNSNQTSTTTFQPAPRKDAFQVKSGIWADSLSRGLIDLNITAPKKVSLADIGIVGGLGDGYEEKEKWPPTSAHMGRAIGVGSSLGKSGYTSSTAIRGDGNSSILGQQQFGSFK